MANFPSFGNAQREAPLFQKQFLPNIQFTTKVDRSGDSPKTTTIKISITNLKIDLVSITLDKIFTYAAESIASDVDALASTSETKVYLSPVIHFEIDVSKAISQSVIAPRTPAETGTLSEITTKTANIDILIDNLPVNSFIGTASRIKTYMVDAVIAHMNP